MSVRTPKTEARYQKDKKEGKTQKLNEVMPIMEWYHWKLIPNEYPHDKLNTKHDMVVLKRECELWNMTNYEIYELFREVLPFLDRHYDYFKLNAKSMRSINNVPHIHVCNLKEEYK